tara:strand:+ start:718 stop:930 length:213 start_codon:yes stop_codon:yes gene_type:complete
MTIPTFNMRIKERTIYRIKNQETGEYCKNSNDEPYECGTEGWAKVMFDICALKYRNSNLKIVKEKYNVKY